MARGGHRSLYSLDLVGHDHGILLADLGGGFGLVVVGAVVDVRVAVEATEQVATATVETCESHSLAAQETSILLGFGQLWGAGGLLIGRAHPDPRQGQARRRAGLGYHWLGDF